MSRGAPGTGRTEELRRGDACRDVRDQGKAPTSGIDRDDDVDARHADALYAKPEAAVLACFYHDPAVFQDIVQRTISLNAPCLSAERRVWQYPALALGWLVPA